MTHFRAEGFTSVAWFRKIDVIGFGCTVAVCEEPRGLPDRGIDVAFFGN
jgi:hypothetical protein